VSEITAQVEALIVTRGAAGSTIYTSGEELAIPAAPVRALVDPTGCGDAYRAGLVHGLLHGDDWRTTGHIASLMGAIKIESRGTQNHRFTSAEFAQRLAEAFP
jgi:adenosine kinase